MRATSAGPTPQIKSRGKGLAARSAANRALQPDIPNRRPHETQNKRPPSLIHRQGSVIFIKTH